MIVTRLSFGVIGLLVETICDFRRIPEQELLTPVAIAGFPERVLTGLLVERNEILIIPDFNKIFSSYIHLQLFPITPSEKLAFQYRLAPGGLTRTLEQTLEQHGYLDQSVVSKLPRSMCLPSVRVHKMTSYYRNFRPRSARSNVHVQPHQSAAFQQTRAGDETYHALLRQVAAPQFPERHHARRRSLAGQWQFAANAAAYAVLWENLLQRLRQKRMPQTEWAELQALQEQVPELLAARRRLAQLLRVTSVRIAKYLTFYQPLPTPPTVTSTAQSANRQADAPHLKDVLAVTPNVNDALAWLHEAHGLLTSPVRQLICQHYRISAAKLAQLCVRWPSLIAPATAVPKPFQEDAAALEASANKPRRAAPFMSTRSTRAEAGENNLAAPEMMRAALAELARQGLLQDAATLRQVARDLRISACRLSKWKSYYRWHNASDLMD